MWKLFRRKKPADAPVSKKEIERHFVGAFGGATLYEWVNTGVYVGSIAAFLWLFWRQTRRGS